MRTHTGSSRRPVVDDAYFERKARELVVADEEIEAWELDAKAFDGRDDCGEFFAAHLSE